MRIAYLSIVEIVRDAFYCLLRHIRYDLTAGSRRMCAAPRATWSGCSGFAG